MSARGHKWSAGQRSQHSQVMQLAALFRKCEGCQRENATKLRRDPKATWAVCMYCGHEALRALYLASDAFQATRNKR